MNKALTRFLCSLLKSAKKSLPTILTIAGGASIVGGTIYIAKKAPEGQVITDEFHERLDEIHQVKEDLDAGKLENETYTDAEYNRELRGIYVNYGKAMLHHYGVGGLLIGAGIFSMASATGIVKKENKEIMSLLSETTAAYSALRERINLLPDNEQLVAKYDGEEVTESTAKETGMQPGMIRAPKRKRYESSMYARFFDEQSKFFNRYDPQSNKEYLLETEAKAMDICRTVGQVSLNDIFELLDIPTVQGYDRLGWYWGKSGTNEDKPISFDIFNWKQPGNRAFVNVDEDEACEAPAVLLDFNIDGIISSL